MKKSIFAFLLVAGILFLHNAYSLCADEPIDFVNTFIGTGGEGFGVGSTFPGPQTPFGMIRPGPDTTTGESAPNFNHCAGYYYKDKQIRGFSHTRMHGTGVPGYGNVLLMPAVGDPAAQMNEQSRIAPLDHSTEITSPGYYAITLPDRGVRVEITAGDRVAFHKYTFPASSRRLLVVDAGYHFGGGKIIDSEIEVDAAAGEVRGRVHYDSPLGSSKGVRTYFVVKTRQTVKGSGAWNADGYKTGSTKAAGVKSGAVLEFDPGAEPLDVKVAISFVSIDEAVNNLAAEQPGWDFDGLRSRTEAAWKKMLSRVVVEGATEKHKKIFYSAMYHSMLMPTLFNDADGSYTGFDSKVHKAEGFRYYTDFSMWDTFRTFHPLLTLVTPEYQLDMNKSLLKMAEQGGYIPKWPMADGYTNCMIGTPADVVIADAYLKGIKDFDINAAYANLRLIDTEPVKSGSPYEGREGVADYVKYGYLPMDLHGGSVSKTLEYAFEDYAISQLAAALGHADDAAMFLKRSSSYKNLWNPKMGFFEGRKSDGTFENNPLDVSWRDVFTEGTAWQWMWFAPHDVEGLIELMGGREKFIARLDEFFEKSHKAPDTFMYDKWYWHGNEPDIYAAYLYLWAGRPDRTQEEVRWIMRKKYDDSPAGLDGNDDGGTMSSWYVFSSIGIFPIPATNRYYIGSPVFERAEINLYSGKKFTIESAGASPKNLYVQSALLNGKPLEHPYIMHSDIEAGGTLKLEMGPTPSKWGSEM